MLTLKGPILKVPSPICHMMPQGVLGIYKVTSTCGRVFPIGGSVHPEISSCCVKNLIAHDEGCALGKSDTTLSSICLRYAIFVHTDQFVRVFTGVIRWGCKPHGIAWRRAVMSCWEDFHGKGCSHSTTCRRTSLVCWWMPIFPLPRLLPAWSTAGVTKLVRMRHRMWTYYAV